VSITDNHVEAYQKTGILANGDVEVLVRDNEIVGLPPTVSIAQNGIQIGFSATGNVVNNSLDSNWFTGSGWTSAGILLFQVDDVNVKRNEVVDSQSGIAVEAWCWFGQASASGNKVMHNTVTGSDYGISVTAVDFSSYTGCDPIVDNNKVVNNVVEGKSPLGAEGIFVGVFEIGASAYTPSADNNKVINNDIRDFDDLIVDDGSATKIHANSMP